MTGLWTVVLISSWVSVKVAQSCLTLCNPMDYTVDGILQARILEWVAFPFSRGSSQPRDWTLPHCRQLWLILYQLRHKGSLIIFIDVIFKVSHLPILVVLSEKAMAPHSSTLAWKIPWMEEPGGLQSMGSRSRTQLSNFTFTFHSHALEKEMATHSSVLAWRIPGTEEPGRLPYLGSHRVWHDWSNLAAVAAAGWIASLSEGLSRVFSNTTVQKHQFFSSQHSLQSNSHVHTWRLTLGFFFS